MIGIECQDRLDRSELVGVVPGLDEFGRIDSQVLQEHRVMGDAIDLHEFGQKTVEIPGARRHVEEGTERHFVIARDHAVQACGSRHCEPVTGALGEDSAPVLQEIGGAGLDHGIVDVGNDSPVIVGSRS